jgi:hypothetical protein
VSTVGERGSGLLPTPARPSTAKIATVSAMIPPVSQGEAARVARAGGAVEG